MANINLTGVLRDPTGEFSNLAKVRFTHGTTTGQTIKGFCSTYTIAADGSYDIDVEYGNVFIETQDADCRRWISHGTITINSDTPATDLPTLLGITTPATDEDLLVFQTLAADAAASAAAAQVSADAAAVSASDLADTRLAKLQNPLCHLFKKNKLVETLVGSLNHTRASGATYIDQYGVLQYSPSPVATNELLWSEDLGNAAWAKSSSTVETNAAISPTGNLTANKVTYASAGSRVTQSFTIGSGTHITLSVYAKQISGDGCRVLLYNSTVGGSIASVDFADFTRDNFFVDDWGRIQFTAANTAGAGFSPGDLLSFYIYSDRLGGSVAGSSLYIWGAQLEEAKVANGYIKTEGTSASGTSYVGIDQSRQEKEGWLIEGASTNLGVQTEVFESANWILANGLTVQDNQAVAPDGSLTAALMTIGTGGSDNMIDSVPITDSGQDFTLSWFIKPNTLEAIQLRPAMTGGTTIDQGGIYNFNTKVWSGSLGSTGKTEELGNGWYRLSVTTTGNGTNSNIQLRLNTAGGLYPGTAWIWGAQLEEKSFPTSYIPTEAAATTRAADDIQFQAYKNMTLLDKSNTFVFTARPISGDGVSGNRPFITAKPEGSTDNFQRNFSVFSDDPTRCLNYVAGNQTTSVFSDTEWGQVASVYDGDATLLTAYANGVSTGTLTPSGFDTSTTPEKIVFNQTSSGTPNDDFGFHIQDFRIYDFALNAAEVRLLSGE